MATYQVDIKNGYSNLYLELTQRNQNFTTNSSVVAYRLYVRGRNGAGFWNAYHTGWTKVIINGKQVHHQTGRDFNTMRGATQELASGTTTISHNSDGTKTFSYSAELWSSGATGKLSGNFTLTTIPRTATITLLNGYDQTITEAETGEAIKIKISDNANFRYIVKYTINGSTGKIKDNVSAGSHEWTVPTGWLSSHLSASTNAIVTLQVETYNSGQLINTQDVRLKIKAPSGTRPSISSIHVSESNTKKTQIIGSTPYYQNLSQLRVQVYASGNSGASITHTQVEFAGQTLIGRDVTFNPANVSGSQPVKVTVTDSRGRTTTQSQTVYLNSYSLPNIALFSAYRSDSNSRIGYAKLNVSNTVMGSNNPLSVIVERSEKESNSWSRAYSSTVGNGSLNTTISVGSTFDNFKAYDIRLKISDRFNSHTAVVTLGASSQSLVIGASDPVIGVGKVPTLTKGLDVAGEILTDDKLVVNTSSGDFVQFKRNGSTVGRLGVSGSNLTFNGNALGASVKQSSSVTSGSNSNGYWVKFDDGTLICYGEVTVNYASGARLETKWTLPAAYKKDSLKHTFASKNSYWGESIYNRATVATEFSDAGTVQVRVWSANGDSFKSGQKLRIHTMAIGRWK